MNNHKVIIIGLDGATFEVIQPMINNGKLYNLDKLMKSGSYGKLMSTIPPITAPAWTSLLTGVNQGKHGLYNFIQRRNESYDIEVTNSNHIKSPTLFNIINQTGKKVISINVPYTSPPAKINGILIGGPFAPEFSINTVYPPSIFEQVKSIEPEYFISPDYDSTKNNPLKDYADKIFQDIAIKENIAVNFLNTYPWDLFMVVFMATDEAQHAFWKYHESRNETNDEYKYVIQDVYERVDAAIGKIIDCVDLHKNENISVIIVSDHGGGYLKWMINLNKWLFNNGYLEFQKPNIFGNFKTHVIKGISIQYKKAIPSKIRQIIRKRLGMILFENIKGKFETSLLTSDIDWEKTKAYVIGAGGNIYINLFGREPLGIVKPGLEYENLLQELIFKLTQLRDPQSGDLLVKKVYRKNELYSGRFDEQAPDLIIHWKDYSVWGRGRYDIHAPLFEKDLNLNLSDIPLSGTHRMEGIFIAVSPRMKNNHLINNLSILDISPIILNLLDIPIPDYFDGIIPNNLFIEKNINARNFTVFEDKKMIIDNPKIDSFDNDDEKILQRLRSLGYL